MSDMQANLIGKQYDALNAGYSDAMKFAQNDLTRELNAGQNLVTIGVDQNNVGTNGLKTLTDLGSIQRKVAQEALDKPMTDAKAYMDLLHGYTIPTGSTKQSTSSGGYENSTLSNIAGITALLNAYTNGNNSNTTDATTYANIAASAKNLGLTLDAAGNFENSGHAKFKWNGTSFVPSPAEGGSINKYAMGGGIGDITGNELNDSAGGSVSSFYNGGYTYDQYGNMIG
jgi:hypothetical protein